jgi:D-sedoheptulose 7-phosphate isomerase
MLNIRFFAPALPQAGRMRNGTIWTLLIPDATGNLPGKPMNSADTAYIKEYLAASREAFAKAADDAAFLASIGKIADVVAGSLEKGGKILLCGNGGSAADAQHIAAELVGRYEIERAPLAAIALTTDTSALTAIGNDYGFDRVFERQVLALGNKGDVLIGISTSGKSPNILLALDAAKQGGLATVGFTGAKGGDMSSCCDIVLHAPSDKTAVIQQIHITAAHVICGLVERRLGKR